MTSPGGGGRGSDRLVTYGDKGEGRKLASDDATIKKPNILIFHFAFLKQFSQ